MTNKEILQADMLDILFEKRNKAYGAYVLRRYYDQRLLTALAAGLAVAVLFVVLVSLKGKESSVVIPDKKEGIVIREYVMPQKKVEEPVQPKKTLKPKAAVKTAQKKFTSTIEIKKDELVKSPVTAVSDLADKLPGDEDVEGKPDEGIVTPVPLPGEGNNTGNSADQPSDFIPLERGPEFPGGVDALRQFLARNLKTPDELDAGDKIMVMVRFKVDEGGFVSSIEIAESGGREFDQEVMRVVKKMPRWQPAFQNGIHVPVSYMIPVTFMGVEY
jgi:protein TonB